MNGATLCHLFDAGRQLRMATTEGGPGSSCSLTQRAAPLLPHLNSLSILQRLYQAMAAHQSWELSHQPTVTAMITQQLLTGL